MAQLQHVVTLSFFHVLNNTIVTLQRPYTIGAGYVDSTTWRQRRKDELARQFGWDGDPWYEGYIDNYVADRIYV